MAANIREKMSEAIKEEINQKFGGRVRTRVGGVLIENEEVLLVKHNFIGQADYLWAPPGGGIEHGQSAEEALKREFLEETGLKIEVGRLIAINEFIDLPLHAIELFFAVNATNNDFKLGRDPEMEKGQILSDIQFFSLEKLKNEKSSRIHNIFHNIKSFQELFNTKGYFKFVNKYIK